MLIDMIDASEAREDDENFKNAVDLLFEELEADKLIVRTEYPQIPPKVEYALSERGKSLMIVLDQLCVWGEENRLTE